jgi:hypothetical protein
MESSRLNWRKASYSGTNGGGCVEVATNMPGLVAVRDSKNPRGPVLTVTPEQWARFVARLRSNPLTQ